MLDRNDAESENGKMPCAFLRTSARPGCFKCTINLMQCSCFPLYVFRWLDIAPAYTRKLFNRCVSVKLCVYMHVLLSFIIFILQIIFLMLTNIFPCVHFQLQNNELKNVAFISLHRCSKSHGGLLWQPVSLFWSTTWKNFSLRFEFSQHTFLVNIPNYYYKTLAF